MFSASRTTMTHGRRLSRRCRWQRAIQDSGPLAAEQLLSVLDYAHSVHDCTDADPSASRRSSMSPHFAKRSPGAITPRRHKDADARGEVERWSSEAALLDRLTSAPTPFHTFDRLFHLGLQSPRPLARGVGKTISLEDLVAAGFVRREDNVLRHPCACEIYRDFSFARISQLPRSAADHVLGVGRARSRSRR